MAPNDRVTESVPDSQRPLFRTLPTDFAAPLKIISPRWSAVFAFAGATLIGALFFSAFAPFPRAQSATGYLAPASGMVRVKAPRSGTLQHYSVAVGQMVKAGEPLFTLTYGEELTNGKRLDVIQTASVERQANLIQQQIEAEITRREVASSEIAARIHSNQAQLSSLQEQRRLQIDRVKMSEEQLGGLKALREKGIVSETQYLARQDNALAQRQAAAALTERIAALENDLRQSKLEKERLLAESADKVAQLEISRSELTQRLGEAAAAGQQVITAPISGQIVMMQAPIGQTVDSTKPLLAIAPPQAPLRAELLMPASTIGYLRPGQEVSLTYDAFPRRTYGSYAGRVEQVSGVLLAPEDVVGPIVPSQPSHRVAVHLNDQFVSDGRHRAPLRADMTIHAEVVLEKRTLLQWLIDSLRGQGST